MEKLLRPGSSLRGSDCCSEVKAKIERQLKKTMHSSVGLFLSVVRCLAASLTVCTTAPLLQITSHARAL